MEFGLESYVPGTVLMLPLVCSHGQRSAPGVDGKAHSCSLTYTGTVRAVAICYLQKQLSLKGSLEIVTTWYILVLN